MMRLSELKALLPTIHNIQLRLESGAFVPEHFHITEVGLIEKHFIDCGGTVRREQRLSLQLWHANDHEHRLHPMKLLNIIRISEQKIHIGDVPIEVELSLIHISEMWGPSIIGFGSYHYKYDSGHEGDAPLIGFSPRKAAISLYTFTGLEEHEHLLKDLGKFKMGKACIYVKKLSDIDQDVLKKMMKETIQYLHLKYGKDGNR